MELDLSKIVIRKGTHHSSEEKAEDAEACALEWVSVLAGEHWSDEPVCTCPVIASFVRLWNDGMGADDETRTRILAPLLPKLIGTRSTDDAVALRRMWMAIDWDLRVKTVAWLRLAGMTARADELSWLPEIVSQETLVAARSAFEAAKKEAAAGVDVTWAAWQSAEVAAAKDAEWAAAGSAAWAAVMDAEWADARNAAWVAAGYAAWVATRDAVTSAAGDELRPTVVELQASAADLVLRMCAVGAVT